MQRSKSAPATVVWCKRLAVHAKKHPLRSAAVAATGLSFLFLILPSIDILVSSWFWDGRHFPLNQPGMLTVVRDVSRVLPFVLVVTMLAVLLVHALAPAPRLLRPHKAAFIIAFYALGPGLLVHVLKASVGRARPAEIAAFGGASPFSPAWQISDACWRSCSFPSGESASATALLALAFLLPKKHRSRTIILLVPVAMFISLNRVFLGAHFLSDVVLAWCLTLLFMLWMWPVFRNAGKEIDAAVIGSARRLLGRVSGQVTPETKTPA